MVRRSNAPRFAATILGMEQSVGLPETCWLRLGRGRAPLVAIRGSRPHRPCDVRPSASRASTCAASPGWPPNGR
jgi:hypothetical protein